MKPKAQPKQSTGEGLAETCYYCQRVLWGEYQYLHNGLWRHAECQPGSEGWMEWYRLHPEKHTLAGDSLYIYKVGAIPT